MKVTYSAAASEDGFIARENGDVAWLDEVDLGSDGNDLDEFFRSIDGLVMGRKTYDFVYNYGSWPYGDKPSWICTHRELVPLVGANLRIVSEIDDVMKQATAMGLEHLWMVGGAQVASAFLARGWLTHLSIAEIPIKLGSGIPLFANHALGDIEFEDRTIIQRERIRRIDYKLKLSEDR